MRTISQRKSQNFARQTIPQNPVLNRKAKLDASEKVPRHPIGAAKKDLRLAGVFKIKDSAVLQEPIHDAPHRNVFANTLEPRPQTANAAHNQINFCAGLRGAIKRLDRPLIHQRICANLGIALGDLPNAAWTIAGQSNNVGQRHSGCQIEENLHAATFIWYSRSCKVGLQLLAVQLHLV